MKPPQPVTFRILAVQEGFSLPDPLPQELPLEKWYASVVDLPMKAFTVLDLARSCRQNLHLDAVIPHCLKLLEVSPLVGEQYDVELLAAVIRLPTEFWS